MGDIDMVQSVTFAMILSVRFVVAIVQGIECMRIHSRR